MRSLECGRVDRTLSKGYWVMVLSYWLLEKKDLIGTHKRVKSMWERLLAAINVIGSTPISNN